MSLETPEDFEDPQLKAALKRMLGHSKAPSSLRERLTLLLAGATATLLPIEPPSVPEMDQNTAPASSGSRSASATPRSSIWNRPLGIRSLAAAAAVLLVGTALATYYTFNEPEWGSHRISAGVPGPAITDALIKDILTQHDASLSNSSAKLKIPASQNSDLSRVRQLLARQINRPVWVADLRKDGWEYRGALVCDVAGQETAQVLFTKGAEAVSLMSMPGPDVCHGNLIDNYDQWVDNHAVCAFGARGQLFCMVGSSPKGELAMTEVEKLVGKFKAEAIAMNDEPHPALATVRD